MDQIPYSPFSSRDDQDGCSSLSTEDIPLYKFMVSREVQTDFSNSRNSPPKKRGRKPSNPQAKACKKKEEKDKFWLRAFRAYIKEDFGRFKKTVSDEDKVFWKEYLSDEGKPETSSKNSLRRFRSYGKQYKDYLFSHSCFQERFQDWLSANGCSTASETNWTESEQLLIIQYAEDELVHYQPASSPVHKVPKL